MLHTEIHNNMEQLELGIQDLIHGQLMPRLIDVTAVKQAIVNSTEDLSSKFMWLYVLTPTDVYSNQSFEFACSQSYLLVRVRRPMTRYASAMAYRTCAILISIPGSQGLTNALHSPSIAVTL